MDGLIAGLREGRDLDDTQVAEAAARLLDPGEEDARKAELLEALARKGESPAEIAGFVRVFLKHAVDPGMEGFRAAGPLLDVCGTGGDKLDLFNVSTTAMFVAAAAGAVVVKHGNRGITSKSGGADVLEAIGIPLDLPPEGFRRCLEQAGVGFLFAPSYHPAFKAVAPVRKQLAERGVRTLFNLIGPLMNPARPECQLVGVSGPGLGPVFADILARLGRRNAWVVQGLTAEGLPVDEVSLMGPTQVWPAGSGGEGFEIHPRDFGIGLCEVAALKGGDAAYNARLLEDILGGHERGPKRDMVLLNAAAAITCAGLAGDMAAALDLARRLIDEGAALDRVERLRRAARG